jgi:subtilisin family serine protease
VAVGGSSGVEGKARTLAAVLAGAKADGLLTLDEWKETLLPLLSALPHRAGPEARALLDTWAEDSLDIDPQVLSGLRTELRARGYPVPSSRGDAARAEAIRAANISEPDRDYERLASLIARAPVEVTVGVLDGGFDLTHPALEGKWWTNPGELAGNGVDDDENGKVDDVHGWDFTSNNAQLGGAAHGTHVTGLASAGTDNVRVIGARVFDVPFFEDTHINAPAVVQAIEYAAAAGARVINMSFRVSGAAEVAQVKDAIKRHPDVLFVKAAGNQGRQLGEGTYAPEVYLPANVLPNMIVVAATGADGNLTTTSAFGAPMVTLATPGSDVYSAIPGERYRPLSGTSMASPHVANTAAKCLSLEPGLSAEDLKRLLSVSVEQRPRWEHLLSSSGVLDPGRAMRLAVLLGRVREGEDVQRAARAVARSSEEAAALAAAVTSAQWDVLGRAASASPARVRLGELK